MASPITLEVLFIADRVAKQQICEAANLRSSETSFADLQNSHNQGIRSNVFCKAAKSSEIMVSLLRKFAALLA